MKMMNKIISSFVMAMLFHCVTCFANTLNTSINTLEQGEKKVQQEFKISKPNLFYSGDSSRDPFKSYLSVNKKSDKGQIKVDDKLDIKPPKLEVTGIICGTKLPQVIINNKILKEGDVLDGVRIIEIKKNNIGVIYMNRRFDFDPPSAAYSSIKNDVNKKEEK